MLHTDYPRGALDFTGPCGLGGCALKCLRLCVPRVSFATSQGLRMWYMYDVNDNTDPAQGGSDRLLVHSLTQTTDQNR